MDVKICDGIRLEQGYGDSRAKYDRKRQIFNGNNFQIEERLSIDECMKHEWLGGAQVYVDLRRLELQLGGERYLTNVEDDARYAHFLTGQEDLKPHHHSPFI